MLATAAGDVTWEGEEKIQLYTSSKWAERGFCAACGSNLFYRVTAPGPHHGQVNLTFGSLTDRSGFSMTKEWFIDLKPENYTFAGERRRITEAEIQAMFADVAD
jgi:hypothetical protein